MGAIHISIQAGHLVQLSTSVEFYHATLLGDFWESILLGRREQEFPAATIYKSITYRTLTKQNLHLYFFKTWIYMFPIKLDHMTASGAKGVTNSLNSMEICSLGSRVRMCFAHNFIFFSISHLAFSHRNQQGSSFRKNNTQNQNLC